MTQEALYALWLIFAGGFGKSRTYRLICQMSAQEAFLADPERLQSVLGKNGNAFEDKDLSRAERLAEDCRQRGIGVVSFHDPEYPMLLREIHQPPVVLFYRGRLPRNGLPTLGIVGTRHCSEGAARLTAEFSCALTRAGFQIVSGMAQGVDTYAHKGALIRHNASFAVLGCGVDVVYPKRNQLLYDLLCQDGGVISEFLPGTQPAPGNFPARNRIISGLSDGVLVTECPVKSGSMITARTALEQDRTVFALPTSLLDKVNDGTNFLIKQGAVFCTGPGDVLQEYLPLYADKLTPTALAEPPRANPTPQEAEILEKLPGQQILTAEEICRYCGRPFAELLPILRGLEVAGHIKSFPGALFLIL